MAIQQQVHAQPHPPASSLKLTGEKVGFARIAELADLLAAILIQAGCRPEAADHYFNPYGQGQRTGRPGNSWLRWANLDLIWDAAFYMGIPENNTMAFLHNKEIHPDLALRPNKTEIKKFLRRVEKLYTEKLCVAEKANWVLTVPDPDNKLTIYGICNQSAWQKLWEDFLTPGHAKPRQADYQKRMESLGRQFGFSDDFFRDAAEGKPMSPHEFLMFVATLNYARFATSELLTELYMQSNFREPCVMLPRQEDLLEEFLTGGFQPKTRDMMWSLGYRMQHATDKRLKHPQDWNPPRTAAKQAGALIP